MALTGQRIVTVIVDGGDARDDVDRLESLVRQARRMAEAVKPGDDLDFAVYGATYCQDLPSGQHIHAFRDDIAKQAKPIERRQAEGTFGGYVYVTPTPEAPHVARHVEGLTALTPMATPRVLKAG